MVKGILDGEDGVDLDESLVHLSQLVAGDTVFRHALEVQVVLSIFAELAGLVPDGGGVQAELLQVVAQLAT